jgi:hypothetical protein
MSFARSENEAPNPAAIMHDQPNATTLERLPEARNDAVWLDWPLSAAALQRKEATRPIGLANDPEQGDILAGESIPAPVVDLMSGDELLTPRIRELEEKWVVALAVGGLAVWPGERLSRTVGVWDNLPLSVKKYPMCRR